MPRLGSRVEQPARVISRDSGWRRRSLSTAFYGAVGLVAVTIVALSIVQLRARQHDLELATVDAGSLIAASAARAATTFMEGIEAKVTASADSIEAQGGPVASTARSELLRLQRESLPVVTAVVADATGIEVARVARDQFVDPSSRLDLSATVAFQRALAGERYTSRPYFVRDSEPYVTVSDPVYGIDGSFHGAVVAEVSLRTLSLVLSGSTGADTAQVYVVTDRAELIAHEDLSLALRRWQVSEVVHVARALEHSEINVQVAPGLTGDPTVSAYATIPGLNWTRAC